MSLGLPTEHLGRWAGVRHAVKVVLGGAPVSCRYAESISADGYTSAAASAVKVIRGLLVD